MKLIMIYGNGLIASSFFKHFRDHEDYSIFASGVSNSAEKNHNLFLLEKELLYKCIEQDRFLVYFSSCSLYDKSLSETPYVKHKLEMESICASTNKYLIFRLPIVVGNSKNKNTLTNFFYNSILNNKKFKLWKKASRVLIDVEDVTSIVCFLLKNTNLINTTINIAHSYSLNVLEIVNKFESILGKSAIYDLINEGSDYKIESTIAINAARDISINFNNNYSLKLIDKYYGHK